jgi:cation diffusion facilitator family transporter
MPADLITARWSSGASAGMKNVQTIAMMSLVVGFAVLALKLLAYYYTGSLALYSDALESIVNIATAAMALIAIRISAKPADKEHPFGHHKVEYFSAVLEGVMIILAAVLIVRAAYDGLIAPKPFNASVEGFAANLLASALNGGWCFVLITRGRRLRSPAIEADGWHLFTDVVSSVGVIAGLLLGLVLDWPLADALLALVVAANILWSGWIVLKKSTGGLMDAAVADATLAEIRETISRAADGAIEAHDVRTRRAGRATFIEFHLVVPGSMTVSDAHDICDRIEEALRADDKDRAITIHLEPEDKAKHSGVVVV